VHAHTSAQTPPEIIPVDILLLAYRSGIFPMADSRDDPEVFWVEPRRRAIIPLDRFHCSRSLAKLIRQERFRVSCNEAFGAVIDACAAPRPGHPESWISDRIAASYLALHRAGYAHSIECWDGNDLVGGLYGVGFDRAFCGESMFSRVRDASKVALAWLVASMRRSHSTLLDCQFMTGHLASMGAEEIPQEEYLNLLSEAQARSLQARPDQAPSSSRTAGSAGGAADALASGAGVPLGFAALLEDAASAFSSPGKLIAQSFTQTS